jgi:hypothetical protein
MLAAVAAAWVWSRMLLAVGWVWPPGPSCPRSPQHAVFACPAAAVLGQLAR